MEMPFTTREPSHGGTNTGLSVSTSGDRDGNVERSTSCFSRFGSTRPVSETLSLDYPALPWVASLQDLQAETLLPLIDDNSDAAVEAATEVLSGFAGAYPAVALMKCSDNSVTFCHLAVSLPASKNWSP